MQRPHRPGESAWSHPRDSKLAKLALAGQAGWFCPTGLFWEHSISLRELPLQSWLPLPFLLLTHPHHPPGEMSNSRFRWHTSSLPDLEKTWSQTATHKALSPAQIHTSNRGWRKIQLQALLHPLTETLTQAHLGSAGQPSQVSQSSTIRGSVAENGPWCALQVQGTDCGS